MSNVIEHLRGVGLLFAISPSDSCGSQHEDGEIGVDPRERST